MTAKCTTDSGNVFQTWQLNLDRSAFSTSQASLPVMVYSTMVYQIPPFFCKNSPSTSKEFHFSLLLFWYLFWLWRQVSWQFAPAAPKHINHCSLQRANTLHLHGEFASRTEPFQVNRRAEARGAGCIFYISPSKNNILVHCEYPGSLIRII